jgi:hypothetical protein
MADIVPAARFEGTWGLVGIPVVLKTPGLRLSYLQQPAGKLLLGHAGVDSHLRATHDGFGLPRVWVWKQEP